MIFKQHQQIPDGTKTQTRRPDFPYELARQLWKHGWSYPRSRRYRDKYEHPWYVPWDEWQKRHPITDENIAEANRILAENVITLPVQPGRDKKAVGRIRITKIRWERLHGISLDDIKAEGYPSVDAPYGLGSDYANLVMFGYFWFRDLWKAIYKKLYRWEDNPKVWVLDFERSEG